MKRSIQCNQQLVHLLDFKNQFGIPAGRVKIQFLFVCKSVAYYKGVVMDQKDRNKQGKNPWQ